MYSTDVFYYFQRQIVVLQSGNSSRRFMPFYAKPLKLSKGVDNQLQFQFLNQEQKPVDLSFLQKTTPVGEITFRLISYEGDRVLIKKALNLVLPVTGITNIILTHNELEVVDTQKCYYSLEIPVGNFHYPVFVDPMSGARGDVDVYDSVLPSYVPSELVSIPTQIFPNTDPSLCSIMGSTQFTYYSSTLNTHDNPVLTFQVNYTEYVGDMIIQGSTLEDTGWYNIVDHSYSYTDPLTDSIGYTVYGYHPYIRLKFVSSYGQVENIVVR